MKASHRPCFMFLFCTLFSPYYVRAGLPPIISIHW
jgi:hypothetical protein